MPHTVGEILLLPAAIKMCEIMHGENFGQALKVIPLSNNTVTQKTESCQNVRRHQGVTANPN
jgi:hypothetical protein